MKKTWQMTLLALAMSVALTVEGQASQTQITNNDLSAALKAAATQHPNVKSKIAELQSLGFNMGAARAAYLPTITAQVQSMKNSSSDGTLRIQETLWSFGKNENAVRMAEKRIDVGKYSLLQVRRQLMEDTAAAYVDLLGAKKRLEIAVRNVEEHDRLYQMILRRQQGGVASEADVRLALSRLIQAQAQRDQLKGAVERLRSDLLGLTQTAIDPYQPVDPILAEISSKEAVLQTAKEKEAKVQLRQAELETAKVEVELSKSEILPTLYARYERDINSTSKTDSQRFGIILEGSVEGLGVAGANRINSKQALLLAAQENISEAISEVQRRVNSLLTERETQLQLMQAYERSEIEMQDTLTSFLRQYDAGRKSWVDVLNSQRELSDTRQQLEQARTSWLEVSLRLAAVTGRLDSLAEVQP